MKRNSLRYSSRPSPLQLWDVDPRALPVACSENLLNTRTEAEQWSRNIQLYLTYVWKLKGSCLSEAHATNMLTIIVLPLRDMVRIRRGSKIYSHLWLWTAIHQASTHTTYTCFFSPHSTWHVSLVYTSKNFRNIRQIYASYISLVCILYSAIQLISVICEFVPLIHLGPSATSGNSNLHYSLPGSWFASPSHLAFLPHVRQISDG